MSNYRLYLIGNTGHIVKAEVIEADTDEAALESARRLLRDSSSARAFEVWELARRVHVESRQNA